MKRRTGYVATFAAAVLLAGSSVASDGESPPSVQMAQERISRTSADAVRVAIQPCWNVNLNATHPIRVRVVMNRDGTVADAELADDDNPSESYQMAAQSALRAVLNPRCQPWPLPASDWPNWQYIELNFDPQ